jgi:hypothetical protein
VGRSAHSRRASEARHRHRRDQCEQVHGPPSEPALAGSKVPPGPSGWIELDSHGLYSVAEFAEFPIFMRFRGPQAQMDRRGGRFSLNVKSLVSVDLRKPTGYDDVFGMHTSSSINSKSSFPVLDSRKTDQSESVKHLPALNSNPARKRPSVSPETFWAILTGLRRSRMTAWRTTPRGARSRSQIHQNGETQSCRLPMVALRSNGYLNPILVRPYLGHEPRAGLTCF